MLPQGHTFDSRQQKAILLLSALIFLTLIALLLLPSPPPQPQPTPVQLKQTSTDETSDRHTTPPASFDPNTVDSATLLSFGISPRKIRNLLNYRRHKGTFRSAEDLERLYTWTAEDVEPLRPYIRIAQPQKAAYQRREFAKAPEHTAANFRHSEPAAPRPAKFTTPTLIDPNTADSLTLCSIPGIGKTISSVIIRYRERLGGFHTTQQLTECKYFTPDLLPWFDIAAEPTLRKLPINQAGFSQLIRHPYIDKEQTKQILEHIRLYGPIRDTLQLRSTHIFTDEQLMRLLPYLDFSENKQYKNN